MLCVNQYPKDYVSTRRSKIEAQLAAYKKLKAGATPAAIAAFEPLFCNNLVLVLESSFMHRARGREGKDGNALNEVRMLAASLLQAGGVLTADKTIRYQPEKSVTGLSVGSQIQLTSPDIERLVRAFFSGMEVKFT